LNYYIKYISEYHQSSNYKIKYEMSNQCIDEFYIKEIGDINGDEENIRRDI
jgi:hypothetical protein